MYQEINFAPLLCFVMFLTWYQEFHLSLRRCEKEKKITNFQYNDKKATNKPQKNTSNTKAASNSRSLPPPPKFVDEKYNMWAAKMRTYFGAQSLCDLVINGSNRAPLPKNPTIAQMRSHNNEVEKEGKILVIILKTQHDDVFIKILTLETPQEA